MAHSLYGAAAAGTGGYDISGYVESRNGAAYSGSVDLAISIGPGIQSKAHEGISGAFAKRKLASVQRIRLSYFRQELWASARSGIDDGRESAPWAARPNHVSQRSMRPASSPWSKGRNGQAT